MERVTRAERVDAAPVAKRDGRVRRGRLAPAPQALVN
jgi:hypothetical protein